MTIEEVRSRIEPRLRAFESLPPQLAVAGMLVRPATELADVSDVSAVDLVQGWMAEYTRAGPALLQAMVAAATDHPRLRVLLVRLLWRFEGSRTLAGRELAERVREIVPLLSPELRSVAFVCAPELLEPARWRQGTDYEHLERRPVSQRPASAGFAPADSIRGQRERLEFLGYFADERGGEWGLTDRAAVTMFQLDTELEATGELDPRSRVELDDLAWGMLCLQQGPSDSD